ncbi:MAG TPA: hypothetical protein VMT32_23435 [Bryobacteraceae bacterium]|jgi:hypothetical protein|nr:hypothetical protein [Bryobacteraceae bacterium]
MTLMDAPQVDATRERRRRMRIIVAIVLGLFAIWLAYHYRNYPQRHAVDQFFSAIQKQDYETAYGVWFHDPAWREHADHYSQYPFNDFYRDWGPGGEWGLVRSYSVDCSLSPSGSSGVIVQVTVNQRAEHAYVWVEKSNRTLSFSPTEIQCGNWLAFLTE